MIAKNHFMKNLFIPLLSLLIFSCQQKENTISPVETSTPISVEKKTEEKKEGNKQIGDTIVMNFQNEKGSYIAEGSLDSIHTKVYVKFRNENPGELNAKIVPTTGKGNIRFNQIIAPDNASDGPFGMDLKIPLKLKGDYVLVIGRSLMADDPFLGKFQVELENN